MTARLYLDPGPGREVGLPGKGNIPSKYMIIGIAPSTKRPKHNLIEPFGSSSYAIIKKLYEKVGSMGGLYVTNLIKEPLEPGKKPPKRLVEWWLPLLYEEIERVQPERIIVLGEAVAKALLPSFTSMREDHGTFFPIRVGTLEALAIPTYHFSAQFRDPMKKPIIARDFERIFSLPKPVPGKFEIVPHVHCIPFPEGLDVSVDLETTGVKHTDQITMMGIGWRGSPSYIVENPTYEDLMGLSAAEAKFGFRLIFHNMAFDLMMLRARTSRSSTDLGFRFTRLPGDTMLWAHLSGERIVNLKHLTTMKTNLPGSRSGGGYTDAQYLAEDVRGTTALVDCFKFMDETFVSRMLLRLATIIPKMRNRGVVLDEDRLAAIYVETKQELILLEGLLMEISETTGTNWNSGQQVVAVLLKMGIPLTETTKTGAYSVAEAVLLNLATTVTEPLPKEFIETLLKYRAYSKLMGGFIEPFIEILKELGALFPSFLLHGTTTGRISCKGPNLQQIPRLGPLKTAFISRWPGGKIGLVDFEQAELRVAALVSEDRAMMEELLSEDMHANMAKLAFPKVLGDLTVEEIKTKWPGLRKASKATTFGTIYGGSPEGLAKRNGLPVENVKAVLRVIQSHFKRLTRWLKEQGDYGIKHLKIVLPFGQIRNLEPEMAYEGPGGVRRKAINTPIQGTAAHCMLFIWMYIAMACDQLGLESYPIANIHDSTMLDIHPDEIPIMGLVVRKAFRALWQTPVSQYKMFEELPLSGDLKIGDNWAKCEETAKDYYSPDSIVQCSSHDEEIDQYLIELQITI